MAALLKDYKATKGNVDVPMDYAVPGSLEEKNGFVEEAAPVKLGRWLFAVRGANEAGKVREDKKALLDAIDPAWAKYDKVGTGMQRRRRPGADGGPTRGENLNPEKRGKKGKKNGPPRNQKGHGFNTVSLGDDSE